MNKYEEAIETLKKNYPDRNFSMLREAVDVALEVLQEKADKQKSYSDGLDYKRS